MNEMPLRIRGSFNLTKLFKICCQAMFFAQCWSKTKAIFGVVTTVTELTGMMRLREKWEILEPHLNR